MKKKMLYPLLLMLLFSVCLFAGCEQASPYSVVFMNGSKQYANVELETPDGLDVSLYTPTKSGNIFLGWYFSPDGGTTFADKLTSGEQLSLGKNTVYARFVADNSSYSIQFDANGGSGQMVDIQAVIGTESALPVNAFTKPAYKFVGWALTPDGAAVFDDGGKVLNLSDTTAVLYAVWQRDENKSVISYYYRGSKAHTEVVDIGTNFVNHSVTVDLGVAADGWYTEDWQYFDETTAVEVLDLDVYLNTVSEGFSIEGGTITAYTGTDSIVILPEMYRGKAVTAIGTAAFKQNADIEIVYLSDNLFDIGDEAFYGCVNLTDLWFNTELTTIGDYAFYDCSALSALSLSSLTELTTIGDYAFYGLEEVREIVVPNSVTSIGYGAFGVKLSVIQNTSSKALLNRTAALQKITLPFIGGGTPETAYFAYIFGGGAEDNWYDSDYRVIEGYESEGQTFAFCNVVPAHLTAVEITGEISEISDHAFDSLLYIESLVLPEGAVSVGDYAFRFCFALKRVEGLSQVVSVGDFAFATTQVLAELSLPLCKFIGEYAFAMSGLLEAPFGNIVREIGDFAFFGSLFREVSIPNTIRIIGDGAFYDSRELTDVIIDRDYGPYERYSMGDYVFYIATEDGEYMMTSDVRIWVPSNTVDDESYVNYRSSIKWQNFASQIFPVTQYGKTGVIIEDDVILGYVGNESTVTLPGVRHIALYAFAFKMHIQRIIMQEGTETIGDFAFYEALNLENINFPNGLIEIGTFAFTGNLRALKIREVFLPDGFKRLGALAFGMAYNIELVRLPASIEYIGYLSFGTASKLERFYVLSTTPPEVGVNETTVGGEPVTYCEIFSYVNSSLTNIYVPAGSKDGVPYVEAYQNAPGFSDFAEHIHAMPSSGEVGHYGNGDYQLYLDGGGGLQFWQNDSFLNGKFYTGTYTRDGFEVTMKINEVGTFVGEYSGRTLTVDFGDGTQRLDEAIRYYDAYNWTNLKMFTDGTGYFDMYGYYATKFTYLLDGETFELTIDGNNVDPENSEYAGMHTYTGTVDKDGIISIAFWLNDWEMEYTFEKTTQVSFDDMAGLYVAEYPGVVTQYFYLELDGSGLGTFTLGKGSPYPLSYKVENDQLILTMFTVKFTFTIMPNGDILGDYYDFKNLCFVKQE